MANHRVFAQDPWLEQAVDEIYSGYGDVVSVSKKRKSLNKFGRTSNADADVKTTVATFQDAVVNETFATANTIDRLVSTSTDDTESIRVEGHTINTTTGALTFVVQSVTLTGQTPATIATPLARCTRLAVNDGTYAAPASDLVGNVTAYDSTLGGGGVTSGKPDVDTAVKCMIPAGKNQSEKCATTISDRDYWIITYIYASVTRAGPQSATVDIDVEYRRSGGVWLPLGLEITLDQGIKGSEAIFGPPFFIVPSNTDVRMVATSDTADSVVTGRINGPLATIL